MKLEQLKSTSVIRDYKRGARRYYPLSAKIRRGDKWLAEAFEILCNKTPNKIELGVAILQYSLDLYVERFEGRLWLRTKYDVIEQQDYFLE
jgi:hypothetical protein